MYNYARLKNPPLADQTITPTRKDTECLSDKASTWRNIWLNLQSSCLAHDLIYFPSSEPDEFLIYYEGR